MQYIKVVIMFYVFGIDIGDDGYGGLQFEERVIVFICFNCYLFIQVDFGVGLVSGNDVVIDYGGINICCIYQYGNK